MSQHNFFLIQLKVGQSFVAIKQKMSRPKNVMVTYTYVMTYTLFSILESKVNLVTIDRTKKNIVVTNFVQFK